jgi:tape measure domain-containing protein
MANDINIRIGAKLNGLTNGIKQAQRELSGFANYASSVGQELSTKLTLPILGVGAAAVKSFADFERMEIGLKAIASEGENAADTMARLQKLAQLPGISLEQAIQGSTALRTVGFEARQAETILQELAKAVTLSGQGPEQLQAVVKQLVQMSSKGKLLQEDLGIILENVPSIGIALQDAFGTTSVDKIRATGISTQQFTAEIIKAISANEKFQSVTGGLSNDIDNFGQAMRLGFAELGRAIAESIDLSSILQSLSGFVSGLADRFKSLSPEMQKGIVVTAGLVAAVGPLVLGIGAVIKVGLSLVAVTKLISGALLALAANPVVLIIAAVTAVGAAIVYAYRNSETFRAVLDGLGNAFVAFGERVYRLAIAPVKAFGQIIKGDLRGAASTVKTYLDDAFGLVTGKGIGDAFSKGYTESIAKSTAATAAGNLGTKGRLGGGVDRNAGAAAPDINAIFANLPTTPPAAIKEATAGIKDQTEALRALRQEQQISGTYLQEEITNQLQLQQIRTQSGSGIGDVTFKLKEINSVSAETIGLQGELAKSAAQLGISFQAQIPQISAAKEKMQELAETFKQSFSEGFGTGLAGIITSVFDGINTDKLRELNEELRIQKDIIADRTADDSAREAAQLRLDAIQAEIDLEKKRGNILLNTAKLAIDTAKQIIQSLLAQAIASAIAGESRKGLLGLITAGVAVAGISALFNSKVPKLADGGIVPPGFEGDKFPAFLNSGEAVIPINRLLDSIAAGGSGGGNFVVRGSDLVLVMDRAQRQQTRITGR